MIIVIMSIISAILYRAGGMSKDINTKPIWIPMWMRNTKFRDLGCPLIGLITIILLGVQTNWWIHLLSYLLCFGALTTYWDWLFGYDNYYFHGFMIGIAYLPYLTIIPIWVIILRIIIIGLFMGLWCKYFSNDYTEEFGRGAIIPLTLGLFLCV